MKRFLSLRFLVLAFGLSGCATAPSKSITPVFSSGRLPLPSTGIPRSFVSIPKEYPAFEEDIDTASLHAAVFQSLSYYQNLPANQLFVLGQDTYTVSDLVSSMADLPEPSGEPLPEPKNWLPLLRDQFAVYQSVGVDPERLVIFSSYYEPTIAARLEKDQTYHYPFYARPPDLVDVNLGLFDPAYQGARMAGKREGRALVPYSTRADIDSRKILADQGLEIAWAKDPLEVLDLQIQKAPDSLDFGNGDLRRIRYDGDNGRKYKSVGLNLISTGRIPAKKFTRQAYLRYLQHHPEERQELRKCRRTLHFFPIGYEFNERFCVLATSDVPLTPWRSMATDPETLSQRRFLAWIDATPGRQAAA